MEFFTVTLWGMEINWLAQVIGLIALGILCYACQKSRRKYLFLMIITASLAIAEAAILSGWTQVIRNTVAVVRNSLLVFYYIDHNKEMPLWVVLCFVMATIIPSAFFIRVWWDIIPPLCSVTFTVFTCQKNYVVQKIGASIVEAASVVYCVLLGAYVGGLRSVFLMIFLLISLFALMRKNKKEKQNMKDFQPAVQTENDIVEKSEKSEV